MHSTTAIFLGINFILWLLVAAKKEDKEIVIILALVFTLAISPTILTELIDNEEIPKYERFLVITGGLALYIPAYLLKVLLRTPNVISVTTQAPGQNEIHPSVTGQAQAFKDELKEVERLQVSKVEKQVKQLAQQLQELKYKVQGISNSQKWMTVSSPAQLDIKLGTLYKITLDIKTLIATFGKQTDIVAQYIDENDSEITTYTRLKTQLEHKLITLTRLQTDWLRFAKKFRKKHKEIPESHLTEAIQLFFLNNNTTLTRQDYLTAKQVFEQEINTLWAKYGKPGQALDIEVLIRIIAATDLHKADEIKYKQGEIENLRLAHNIATLRAENLVEKLGYEDPESFWETGGVMALEAKMQNETTRKNHLLFLERLWQYGGVAALEIHKQNQAAANAWKNYLLTSDISKKLWATYPHSENKEGFWKQYTTFVAHAKSSQQATYVLASRQ